MYIALQLYYSFYTCTCVYTCPTLHQDGTHHAAPTAPPLPHQPPHPCLSTLFHAAPSLIDWDSPSVVTQYNTAIFCHRILKSLAKRFVLIDLAGGTIAKRLNVPKEHDGTTIVIVQSCAAPIAFRQIKLKVAISQFEFVNRSIVVLHIVENCCLNLGM